jgi:hypothetical protein
MTATLADDTILVSHFQANPAEVAKPRRSKGGRDIGDRMILAPQEINPDYTVEEIKTLISNIANDMSRHLPDARQCRRQNRAKNWHEQQAIAFRASKRRVVASWRHPRAKTWCFACVKAYVTHRSVAVSHLGACHPGIAQKTGMSNTSTGGPRSLKLKLPRFGGRFRGWRTVGLLESLVRSKWASDTPGRNAAGWDCRSL